MKTCIRGPSHPMHIQMRLTAFADRVPHLQAICIPHFDGLVIRPRHEKASVYGVPTDTRNEEQMATSGNGGPDVSLAAAPSAAESALSGPRPPPDEDDGADSRNLPRGSSRLEQEEGSWDQSLADEVSFQE